MKSNKHKYDPSSKRFADAGAGSRLESPSADPRRVHVSLSLKLRKDLSYALKIFGYGELLFFVIMLISITTTTSISMSIGPSALPLLPAASGMCVCVDAHLQECQPPHGTSRTNVLPPHTQPMSNALPRPTELRIHEQLQDARGNKESTVGARSGADRASHRIQHPEQGRQGRVQEKRRLRRLSLCGPRQRNPPRQVTKLSYGCQNSHRYCSKSI